MAEFYQYYVIEDQLWGTLNISFFTESLQGQVELPNTFPQTRTKLQRILGELGLPQGFPNITFQMEVSRCSKSIYVDHDYQLDQFRTEILRNGRLKSALYKGKESFQKKLYSWSISNAEWDRTEMISRRINAISYSGIFKHIDDIYRTYKMKSQLRKLDKLFRETKEGQTRPLALKTTIISVFLIYLGCVSVCISVLVTEKLVTLFLNSFSFELLIF
jgi:hypothetical protein